MKLFKFAVKAAIGIAAIALGAEKIGSAVSDAASDIKADREAKKKETSEEETEE